MPPAKQTAVAQVAKELSQEELNKLLQGAGYASPPSERAARLKLDGQVFVASDTGDMYVYNPKQPSVPAFTARIVKPVEDYMAIFIDDSIARGFEREDLAGTFSKSYFQANPDRRTWPSDDVYDELARRTDLLDKDGKPLKPSWKGDLLLQILPEDGTLTGEETQYILTLPTTSLIEFRGSSRDPEAGAISEFNFMQKLVRFAIAGADGIDPSKAVLDALTSYAMGGVVAEARVGRAESKERNQSWPVIIFDPIHIEPMVQGDNLIGSGDPDEVGL